MSDELTTSALDLLRTHGPLDIDELAHRLSEQGYGSEDSLVDELDLLDDTDIPSLRDGRFVDLASLVEGRVFTHRLSATEIASDLVSGDDFDAVLVVPTDPDSAVSLVFPDEERDVDPRLAAAAQWLSDAVLMLPEGALTGRDPGDLVGVTVSGGRLTFLPEVEVTAELPALRAAVTEVLEDEAVVALEDVVWQLMADDPAAFAQASLPITELVDVSGLDRSGNLVAEAGFDFDGFARESSLQLYADQLGISVEAAAAAALLVALVDALERDDPEAEGHIFAVPEHFDVLADQELAHRVAREVLDHQGFRPEAAVAAADLLLRNGSRRVTAFAHWFAGFALETAGRVDDAEQRYEKAISSDGSFGPALIALAGIVSDRGEAVRGLSLLARTEGGGIDTDLYDLLVRFQPAERTDLGRNQPCWCGSGRKYKVCHLRSGDYSLAERAEWLYEKAIGQTRRGWRVDRLLDLAEIRAAHWEPGYTSVLSAMADATVLDVMMAEDGVFDEFVEHRGHLLPEEEAQLAAGWSGARRSLFEVESGDGARAVLREIRTDERVEVRDPRERIGGAAGTVVAARPLVVGDEHVLLGGFEPVEPEDSAAVAAVVNRGDADAEAVVEMLTVRFASFDG
ncbi:hypothetical protein G4H71_18495 [Rhodococcus triatomae]|uniref:SEC-C motif-containing protein n=1 Tax=Rhodococcus triatomae TaxID=300028 RepID=A0A1G8EWU7_9NOCA|nr:SEC-C metal-binding domain-containing protein [Rhodococcus triatomae]QNG19317.1 hypothetical protein G4H72_11880 [Rhodococcus triatomae]QNG24770.1 hypothetical protein G4H71_18495 [Rhodococcus triatomae]SDH74287.1 SEC-C motif-containing protein [Rhodococcus triatomae]